MRVRGLWIAVGLLGGCFSDPDAAQTEGGDVGSSGAAASETTQQAGSEAGPGSSGDAGVTGDTTGQPPGTTEGSDTAADDTAGPVECDCPYPGGHCVSTGACARWVFLSSAVYPGDLGGLMGADMRCQQLANDAGLSGTFRAFLGIDDDAPTAFDRIGALPMPPAVWIMPGGAPGLEPVVAYDFAQLRIDEDPLATLTTPIQRDEHGTPVDGGASLCPFASAWTGLDLVTSGTDCANWTGGVAGSLGNAQSTDNGWVSTGCPGTCSSSAHLYCFEVPPRP